MAEYAFYSFVPDTGLGVGQQLLPVPVRREMESEVFGGDEVRVDLLYEELAYFISEYPDFKGLYSGTNSALAWLLGISEGMDGNSEAAARHLRAGLESSPDSLLLRSNFALALQMQGKGDDALEQYEIVLAEPQGRANPLVCLLAARLYVEREEYVKAYRLLDELAKGLPAEDEFWDFLAEVRELAGLDGAGEIEFEDRPTPELDICPVCSATLRQGASFCSECGAPVAKASPRRAFCRECGSPVSETAAFCRNCGLKL